MDTEPLVDLNEFRHHLAGMDSRTTGILDQLIGFEQQEMVAIAWSNQSSVMLSCLLYPDDVPRLTADASFDLSPGGGQPQIVGRSDGAGGMVYGYEPVGSGEAVPLVHDRALPQRFGGNVLELAEDFRLFWDLYEDRDSSRFLAIDEVGDVTTVAEMRDGQLLIKKSFLRCYQAARQLALSLQIDFKQHGGDELAALADVRLSLATDHARFVYHGGRHDYNDGYFTRLLGKRIIPPPPIERSGVWPHRHEKEYEEFVIGYDTEGEPASYTSDPDLLANYFGANPDAPHYLTPVFFSRTVLDKYYADPDRYKVADGHVTSEDAWTLSIDNGREDQVAVFLGDLGRDLPTREQQYWKSFNVPPPGTGISKAAFQRSFLAQFHESDNVEHQVQVRYQELNTVWTERFGWPLFTPPHEDDAHVLEVRIPPNESVAQFDSHIVPLAKLVVDFLNEAEIKRAVEQLPKDPGSINRIEQLLREQQLPDEALCAILREIQGARTRSAAHRKAEDYSRERLLAGSPNLQARFREYLESLTHAMTQLREAL